MLFKEIMADLKKVAQVSELNRMVNPEMMSSPDVPPDVEQLTWGPSGNNLSWKWSHDEGTWDFFILDKINSDILLLYLSRMAQMYLKVSQVNLTSYITRDFKSDLLKDKYPVFTVSKNWSV